eukprot:TRINITY_DN31809_c0_g1_i1.p1 TRINITY_DN31809_c0_g1~~TRINITY_DN31809_c0_g1_i1.p1  ORF type:complete len:184 (+),score=2.86 TRINITY_DN31809_c0_g1_i1:96-647(+)
MKLKFHPSLTVLVWHGVCGIIALITAFGWAKGDDHLSSATRIAYPTIALTYVTIYLVAAGPILLKAAFDALTPQETSRLQFTAGSSLWILGDLPLFIANFVIYLDQGFVSIPQGIEFIMRMISFLFGFALLWISGLNIAINWLHRRNTCDEDLTDWAQNRNRWQQPADSFHRRESTVAFAADS